MNRRGFLSRLLMAAGIAPAVGLLPKKEEESPYVTVGSTCAGSFSNHVQVEFTGNAPHGVWVNQRTGEVFNSVTASEGQTFWLSEGIWVQCSTENRA